MKKCGKELGALRLTMMALGTIIGGSFFLGSAVAIHEAGPLILLGFAAGGIIVYFILLALSEMTVASPDRGSFCSFATRVFGRGTGFVVGWVYWTGMVLAMSSEAAAVSILVKGWFPEAPLALLGGMVIALVTLLNLAGAGKLSKLESALAGIKLLAIVSFIIIALLLITGLMPGTEPVGIGALANEPVAPGGFMGLAGSMLIVLFTYAGFEIIGLAASETKNPRETVPRAIKYTVVTLVALYILYIGVLLPLIPTADIDESMSPIVTALNAHGFSWAGMVLNIVLITAIFSTMLAAMFGLGRIIGALATAGLAPVWLRDSGDVPCRGILLSGFAMLSSLGVGLLFPRVYLFLISSGGFALLFSYAVIMATQIKFRRENGCPPEGKCQIWGFPYTSYAVLVFLIAAVLSMPLIAGQTSGLIAGLLIAVFYVSVYLVLKINKKRKGVLRRKKAAFSSELSGEISPEKDAGKGKNDSGV